MSFIIDMKKLMATAQALAEEAKTDHALAERLLQDPGATISEIAGVPLPPGITLKASHAADDAIKVDAEGPLADHVRLDKMLGFGTLFNVAIELSVRAKDDPALAEKLLADPGRTLEDYAGYPVPEGIAIIAEQGPSGEINLTPSSAEEFSDEPDDMLLKSIGADVLSSRSGAGPAANGMIELSDACGGDVRIGSGGGSRSAAPVKMRFRDFYPEMRGKRASAFGSRASYRMPTPVWALRKH